MVFLLTYYIKKTNNNEYQEINKNFKLNVSKYVGDTNTLYFDVEGQDLPYLSDYQMFFKVIFEQNDRGLIESLDYNDGVLKVSFRDGNIIKNYTYDFSLEDFDKTIKVSAKEKIIRSLYKIVSMYRENPNSQITSRQKYIWIIYDIIDRDRIPMISDENELRRIFQVYNYDKNNILTDVLNNVKFYQDGRPIEFKGRVRDQRINSIRGDVMMQMDAAMSVFAYKNNASKIYDEYLENLYIEPLQLYFEDTNQNENEEEKKASVISVTKELINQGVNNLRETAVTKKNEILDKKDDILMRIKKKN